MNKQLDIPVGEQLILNVTKADIENTGEFLSCTSCLLATAAKRQFNSRDVRERGNVIKISGVDFEHRLFRVSEYRSVIASKQPFSITLTRMYA